MTAGDTLDRLFMEEALKLARAAEAAGEVPVGALLVADQRIVAAAGNSCIQHNDPTAHAEMLVLRQAGATVGNYRLPGTSLYVTLEPCPMCAGALVNARVERLVYAAADPHRGAAGSCMNLVCHPRLNHRVEVTTGIMAEECSVLLRDFFRQRR